MTPHSKKLIISFLNFILVWPIGIFYMADAF